MVCARRRAEIDVDHHGAATLYFSIAYLIFALIMTMAGKFPDFGALFPHWLFDTFNPNDKTNLAPYRFIHFVVIVIMVIRFVPKDWPGLEWRVFDPLIVCGQQSLAVFCVGVFLSFVGHFELMMSSGSLFAQIFVSVTGIAIMTVVAYYISWSKRQDKRPSQPQRRYQRPAKGCQKATCLVLGNRVSGVIAWLDDHEPASRRNAAPGGGPADFGGRRLRDRVLASFSLQRESSSLRVSAPRDPAATRQFKRPGRDLPPAASTRSTAASISPTLK